MNAKPLSKSIGELQSLINGHVSKSVAKKRFKQGEGREFLHLICPACKFSLGLEAEFVLATTEMNYKYICPYCGHEGKLPD